MGEVSKNPVKFADVLNVWSLRRISYFGCVCTFYWNRPSTYCGPYKIPMILSGKALNYIFHELDIRSSLSSWKGCLTFQPRFFNPDFSTWIFQPQCSTPRFNPNVQPQGSTSIFNPGLFNHELFNPINFLGLKNSWLECPLTTWAWTFQPWTFQPHQLSGVEEIMVK